MIVEEVERRLEIQLGSPLTDAMRDAVQYVVDRVATGLQVSSLLSGRQRLTSDPALCEHLGLSAADVRTLSGALLGTRSAYKSGCPSGVLPAVLGDVAARGDADGARRSALGI